MARELPVEERKRMEQFEAARQAALAREDAPELESQLRAECESRGAPVDLAGLLRHVEAAAKLAGAFDGLAAREERPKAWMVTRVRSILERDDIPSNVAERLAHSIVAAFAPEVEELPGDGQRPDHLEAAISEVMRRTPRGAVFTRTQAEWIALGVLAAKKVVRDTEREHEHHWTTTGRLDSGTGRHEWVCTCDERIWTDDPDGPEGGEPVYTNVTREVGDAIAAACDHYRRVGLQPTGTVVAGRVSDILGGRTEREHEPAEPFAVPAGQEHPSRSRDAYLCGECGEVSYADDWLAFKYDDEGEHLIPAESGYSDPLLRCPVCKTDHENTDSASGVWGGTRKEMYDERATQVANPITADYWIGFWKDRATRRESSMSAPVRFEASQILDGICAAPSLSGRSAA